MAEEEVEAEKTEGKSEGKPKSNTMMMIIIMVLGFVINAGIIFLVLKMTAPPTPEEIEREAMNDSLQQANLMSGKVGVVMEENIDVIVNIAGTDGERFLKVVASIEYDDQSENAGLLQEELLKRHVKFQDILLELLSSMTLDELNDVNTKANIRTEFKRLINKNLPKETGGIMNVYLKKFIIQ